MTATTLELNGGRRPPDDRSSAAIVSSRPRTDTGLSRTASTPCSKPRLLPRLPGVTLVRMSGANGMRVLTTPRIRFGFATFATSRTTTSGVTDGMGASALPAGMLSMLAWADNATVRAAARPTGQSIKRRSEEHTSELQSLAYLVCRLLLEKKKKRST